MSYPSRTGRPRRRPAVRKLAVMAFTLLAVLPSTVVLAPTDAEADWRRSSASDCSIGHIYWTFVANADDPAVTVTMWFSNYDSYYGDDIHIPVCDFGGVQRFVRANPEVGQTSKDGPTFNNALAGQERLIPLGIPCFFPDVTAEFWEHKQDEWDQFAEVEVTQC